MLVLAFGGGAARSATSLQDQIASAKTAASNLRARIDAESRHIQDTAGGLADARRRLDAIQTDLDDRVAALRRTQGALLTSRDRLIALENRLHIATGALAANLRASYEGVKTRPDDGDPQRPRLREPARAGRVSWPASPTRTRTSSVSPAPHAAQYDWRPIASAHWRPATGSRRQRC